MDLKDNKIKMGELLKNEEASKIIKREFSEFYTPMLIALSRNMSLESVLSLAQGKVDGARIDRALDALRAV